MAACGGFLAGKEDDIITGIILVASAFAIDFVIWAKWIRLPEKKTP
jgi:hypothetical protein